LRSRVIYLTLPWRVEILRFLCAKKRPVTFEDILTSLSDQYCTNQQLSTCLREELSLRLVQKNIGKSIIQYKITSKGIKALQKYDDLARVLQGEF